MPERLGPAGRRARAIPETEEGRQKERVYEEPRKIPEPSLSPDGRRRRSDDGGMSNPDISRALMPYPSDGLTFAKQRDEARWAKAAASELSIPEFNEAAADMGRQGENSQNVTNEPNFDQEVLIEQIQEAVGVEANSGADSGIDIVTASARLPIASCDLPVASDRDEARSAPAVDSLLPTPDSRIASEPSDPQLPTPESHIAHEAADKMGRHAKTAKM